MTAGKPLNRKNQMHKKIKKGNKNEQIVIKRCVPANSDAV